MSRGFIKTLPSLEYYFFSNKLISIFKTRDNKTKKFIYWAEIKNGNIIEKRRISENEYQKILRYQEFIKKNSKNLA